MLRMTGDITYISRCGVQYRNEHLEPLGLSYRQADMPVSYTHLTLPTKA